MTNIYAPKESLNFSASQIEIIEKHYDAQFVIEAPHPLKNGNYGPPCAIFYHKKQPTNPSYSRYFALRIETNAQGKMSTMISDGLWIVDEIFAGLLHTEDGLFFNSRSRHDMRPVGNSFVDGGQDYFRRGEIPPGYEVAYVKVLNGMIVPE